MQVKLGPYDKSIRVSFIRQVWSAPPASLILSALEGVRSKLCGQVACTLVPVAALHNATTFLSASALRLDE